MLQFIDITACTLNNGHLSEWFTCPSGLLQGNPVTPYLFLLCGEVMAHSVRQNKNIKGIRMNDIINVISQVADDTALFLLFDKASSEAAVKTMVCIECNTRLQINYDKTCIYRIWSLAESNVRIYTQKTL